MLDGFEEIGKNNLNVSTKDAKVSDEIRPLTFDDYIGQEELKKQLKIFIKASIKRDKPLAHTLLFGAPGLGKTTLAAIVANELGVAIHYVSAASIEKPADLASVLMQANNKDIIFIDEIHALHHRTEEFLHPAMEDFVLDITIQNGSGNKPIRVPLEQFTLIGATTKPGSLSKPFRDRFGFQQQLQFYTDEELSRIIKRTAKIIKIDVKDDVLLEIAKRSRKTARIANNILMMCGDFAIAENNSNLTMDLAKEAFNSLGVDDVGLNRIDRELMILLFENFDNKPTGLKNLASLLQENTETLETIIEPYLLQLGLIQRTNRGRQLTSKGLGYVLLAQKNK